MTISGSFRPFSASRQLGVDLFFVVLGGQAPRGVLGVGRGAALGARLEGQRPARGLPLLGPRFFEPPMASLFHGVAPRLEKGWNGDGVYLLARTSLRLMSEDSFDVDAMIERFRTRAKAVRSRGMPPVEGPERKRFVEQMQLDYMDYAMLGDAEGTLEDGILTLRVDLRPKPEG